MIWQRVVSRKSQAKVIYPVSTFSVLSENLGLHLYPANIYVFKVNDNAKKWHEICSKLKVKTPKPLD